MYLAEKEQFVIPTPEWVSNNEVANEVAVDDKQGRLIARKQIESFQSSLQNHVGSETGIMDQVNDNGLSEFFVGGAYIRRIIIPANIAIVSKIWTKERFWIISEGEVTFKTEMGTQRVKAHYTKIVPPGSKVALFTHTDTIWYAITGATGTTTEEVEKQVTADDYAQCSYPWDKIEGGDSMFDIVES